MKLYIDNTDNSRSFSNFHYFSVDVGSEAVGYQFMDKGNLAGGEADEFIVVRFEVECLQDVHSSGDAQYAVVNIWSPGGGHV